MEAIRQDTRQAVERLERQVARLRSAVWLLFLALFGSGGYLAWQRLHPKVEPSIVKVKGLFVEDGNGPARLLITSRGIRVSDEQGQSRIELSLKEDGSEHLVLTDAQGEPALTASPSTLSLTNAKKDAAVLSTVTGPTLQLRRADKVLVKQPYDAQELK